MKRNPRWLVSWGQYKARITAKTADEAKRRYRAEWFAEWGIRLKGVTARREGTAR